MPKYFATDEEREYYRIYRREQYAKGGKQKENHLIRVAARRKEIWEWYIAQKDMKPCTDCKEPYPYYVMDWDHLDGKTFNIGRAATYSIQRLQEEIAKCELVCSNCHRERTHKRSSLKS